jgi:hypothetical protein
MNMKSSHLIIALAILTSIAYAQSVAAQPTQSSYTVNLTYMSIQLSFPSEVLPGDSVTVSLQANSKGNINVASLTATIYYADGTNLHQVATATLGNNYYMSSGTLSKQIQFSIPQDAPRTSLMAVLSENVQVAYYSYDYYYAPYDYSNNYSSRYCYYYPYCYFDYGYAYYPSYSYSSSSDSGIAPLSYIKATTPEYVSLQTEYQMVQQQLTQSQAENQQLKQNLQDAQNTLAQKNSTIATLNQQLSSAQSMIGELEVTSIILAIIAVAIGIFTAYKWREKTSTQEKDKA